MSWRYLIFTLCLAGGGEGIDLGWCWDRGGGASGIVVEWKQDIVVIIRVPGSQTFHPQTDRSNAKKTYDSNTRVTF